MADGGGRRPDSENERLAAALAENRRRLGIVARPTQQQFEFEDPERELNAHGSAIVVRLVRFLEKRDGAASLTLEALSFALRCSRRGLQYALRECRGRGWIVVRAIGPHAPSEYRLSDALHRRSPGKVENLAPQGRSELHPRGATDCTPPASVVLASLAESFDVRHAMRDRARTRHDLTGVCNSESSASFTKGISRSGEVRHRRELRDDAEWLARESGMDPAIAFAWTQRLTRGEIAGALSKARAAADQARRRGTRIGNYGGYVFTILERDYGSLGSRKALPVAPDRRRCERKPNTDARGSAQA